MPIDFLCEHRLTAKEAAAYLPSWRPDKPTHTSRVIRAITKGSPGPDGRRHFLEAARLNGQWITTREAVQRFLVALSSRQPAVERPRSSGPPSEAHHRAERELAALGL